MSFELDDSIQEDFIAEAGELVDGLGEELVRLEQEPDNPELLNSIFRAFHTVKGGAGFLNLASLVETCHSAENVFDALRRGDLELNSEIMDTVLQALDVVTDNMDSLRSRSELARPSAELIARLRGFVGGPKPTPAPAAAVPPEQPEADAADLEFEAMLAEAGAAGTPDADSDEITDDEFEALLDELEGKGRAVTEGPAPPPPDVPNADEINDDEFEALLDQLHGPGGSPTVAEPPPQTAPAADQPAPGPESEAARSTVAKAPIVKAAAPAPRPDPADPPAPPAAAGTPPASGAVADRAVASAVKQAAAPAESSVRVDVSRLDTVMNLVGELVLVRNRLVNLGTTLHSEDLRKAVGNLDLVTGDLQMGVMQTRMQPIKKVFSRFPRLTRDLARTLKKEVNLVMRGEDTDLDKNLVEALADPLIHLVRNSLDHGIEMPEVREQNGKPRAGTVELAAEQQGDHIVITIRDDGAGIAFEKLRDKAVSKGQISAEAAAKMTRDECFALMFAPGLSTCDKVSEVSGRGVGMDVVKTRMSELNGVIEIDSEVGAGTTIRVRVPLTLAILPTLMVRLRERVFAFPLTHVVEVFFLDRDRVRRVEGRDVIMVRGKPLPLVFLHRLLLRGVDEPEGVGYVVVVQIGSERIGFVTDDVLGQEEVVIKPLGALLKGVRGFAGATITGDGKIALIIDVNGLLRDLVRG